MKNITLIMKCLIIGALFQSSAASSVEPKYYQLRLSTGNHYPGYFPTREEACLNWIEESNAVNGSSLAFISSTGDRCYYSVAGAAGPFATTIAYRNCHGAYIPYVIECGPPISCTPPQVYNPLTNDCSQPPAIAKTSLVESPGTCKPIKYTTGNKVLTEQDYAASTSITPSFTLQQ